MYNFSNDKAIYLQIKDDLLMKIIGGYYKTGDKLESVRELASYYTVNPNTILRVISEFENEALITIERGKGTFITTDDKKIKRLKMDWIKKDMLVLIEKLIAIGLSKTEILKQIEIVIDEVKAND